MTDFLIVKRDTRILKNGRYTLEQRYVVLNNDGTVFDDGFSGEGYYTYNVAEFRLKLRVNSEYYKDQVKQELEALKKEVPNISEIVKKTLITTKYPISDYEFVKNVNDKLPKNTCAKFKYRHLTLALRGA